MSELKKGDKISLAIGGHITIIKELGRGGQGIVYLVDVNSQQMALKWYLTPPDDAFYQNLQHNVQQGAPSDAFLWPKYLTKKEKGSYGYVMDLRPSNYYEFGNYLLAKKSFKSFSAMLAAAMKICDGFMMLHRFGYSYQDLNDGNFFIEPTTGDVLICDNDNVMPQGEKSGIMGKARYMAPEVVAGGIPDKYSDRYSLSVILFMLFFANHPLEGAKVVACPCLTESFEKKFYGSEAVFIYDEKDKSNLPVRGVHQNVIRRWPIFPQLLKDTFREQFSQETLRNKNNRLIEQGWQKIIATIRDSLVICPICGEETFVDLTQSEYTCMNPNCAGKFKPAAILKLGLRNIPILPKSSLYIDNDNIPDAKVVRSQDDQNLLLIQNLSASPWIAETPSGKIKTVEANGFMPVKVGIKVSFGSGNKAEIIQ